MRALPALAKLTFAGFLISLVVGLVAAFGTRFGYWDYQFGLFKLFPWCLAIGAATFLCGVVWVLWALIANDSSGRIYGLIGLVGIVIVLAKPVREYRDRYGLPPVPDVSTDTENPPAFVALVTHPRGAKTSADYEGDKIIDFDGKTSTMALLQHKYYSDIHSAAILISPDRLFKRAVAASYAMGWNIIAIVPSEGRIEATDTTFFFGFTDDIVIRVKPAGMGAKLDIRSKARVDGEDLGRNIQRVHDFLAKLATEQNI
jgi:Protein of unknown function (DUF1499)